MIKVRDYVIEYWLNGRIVGQVELDTATLARESWLLHRAAVELDRRVRACVPVIGPRCPFHEYWTFGQMSDFIKMMDYDQRLSPISNEPPPTPLINIEVRCGHMIGDRFVTSDGDAIPASWLTDSPLRA